MTRPATRLALLALAALVAGSAATAAPADRSGASGGASPAREAEFTDSLQTHASPGDTDTEGEEDEIRLDTPPPFRGN